MIENAGRAPEAGFALGDKVVHSSKFFSDRVYHFFWSHAARNCPLRGFSSLTFDNSAHSTAPLGTGGTVWAPDYWPIMLPFAVRNDATAIEVYECDLDYAFGLYIPPPLMSLQTTDWGTSNGCVPPATSGPASPVPGSDAAYQHTLADTLVGQPTSSSFRTGTSMLVYGSQF